MRIEITLDDHDPPVGRLADAEAGEARPFTGWLGLLAALSAAIEARTAGAPPTPTSAIPTGGDGGELDA